MSKPSPDGGKIKGSWPKHREVIPRTDYTRAELEEIACHVAVKGRLTSVPMWKLHLGFRKAGVGYSRVVSHWVV